MSLNKSNAIRATAALVLLGSLAIGIHLLRGPDRDLSSHANRQKVAPQENERSESKGESTSKTNSDRLRSDNSDAYAWLREEIAAQASKQGKSKKDVAVEKINEARLTYGSADGMYSSLCDAFWDEPEVFLEAMKATAQGKEQAYAVACYLCLASKQTSVAHLEKAYQILNPGSARTSIAKSWASMVAGSQGLDQSISLIENFEINDERRKTGFLLIRYAERAGMFLTPEPVPGNRARG